VAVWLPGQAGAGFDAVLTNLVGAAWTWIARNPQKQKLIPMDIEHMVSRNPQNGVCGKATNSCYNGTFILI
jgi:hypothetical protein